MSTYDDDNAAKYGKYKVAWAINDLFKKYGPIFKQEIRNNKVVFVCEPGDYEIVSRAEGVYPYRGPIPMFSIYNKRKNMPDGLATLNGEEWLRVRRPTQMNMMRPITVARYFPLMSEISDDFIEMLRQKEVLQDIRGLLKTFAIEHAGYLCFNRRLGLLENPDGEFNNHFHEVFRLHAAGFFQIPLYNYFRTPSYKKLEKHMDELLKFFKSEVNAAMEKLEQLKLTGQFYPDNDPHLLHQLLADDPHSAKTGQIGMTIFSLFVAGGETLPKGTRLIPTFFQHNGYPHSTTTAASKEVDSSRTLKSIKDIPGPPFIYQIPYIGFAFHLQPFTKYNKYNAAWAINDLFKKYGPVFKQEIRNKEMIFVSDPADFEKVSKAEGTYPYRGPLPMFSAYNKRRNLPEGLGTLNGEEWLSVRRPTQMNMLRPITVARYFPLMSEISDDFVKILKEEEVVLDIRKDLVTFAIENAGYLSFNRRLGLLENPNGEINHHFNELFRLFGLGIFQIPLYNHFRTSSYKKFEKHTDALHQLVKREVNAAMEKLDKLKSTGQFDPDKDPHLLHQLLADPHMVKTGQVGLTVFGLFAAGGETTASSLSFLLYELAKNKRVQDTLYQEIDKNLPDDKVLTEAALKKMSYVKACLKESMRYTFPLPGGVDRKLAEDIVVQDYLLPKGTVVSMNQNIVVTRNPDIFEDPDEFKPERWLRNTTDRQKSVHSHALLPFGIGPRSCIGRRFAEMEIHTCLAKIIQHLEVSLVDPDKEYELIYKPFPDTTEPIALRFTKRNK